KYNAYSTFNFGAITELSIGNDEWVSPNTVEILWCNENIFNINRCKFFVMDGTYHHDFNRFYGGCFEGDSIIEIRKGKNNRFYDLRLEHVPTKSPTIRFLSGTRDNIIHYHFLYHINVFDEGYRNSISYTGFNNARLLNMYSVKVDTFNPTYNIGFKNIELTADGLGIKPKSYAL